MRALLAALILVAAVPAVSHAQVSRKIVIDPGHGGSDPGGVGTGMQEKNVVLDTSKRFRDILNADNADNGGGGKWTTAMTRTTDVFVGLSARAQYSNAQGADRFMSIHANAFGNTTANGTETFSYSPTDQGSDLRNKVQAEMIAAWGLTNRGNKTADFAVLRETACPAILHELAFITNPTDAAKLASGAERQKAAIAHLKGLQKHYGIAPYVPGAVTPPTDTDGSIAGVVFDDLGPVAGAKVTLDDTTSVVTDSEGTFMFDKVAAGAHHLAATAEKHDDGAKDVDVVATQATDTEIELKRTPDGMGSDGSGSDGMGGDPGIDSGCATGGHAGTGALLVVALMFIRRRKARS